MPSADFCAAIRSTYVDLSLESETQTHISRAKPAALPHARRIDDPGP